MGKGKITNEMRGGSELTGLFFLGMDGTYAELKTKSEFYAYP